MTVGYLLDTNVVSEVRKRNGSVSVRDWIDAAHGPTLYMSSLTVGEIRCGVELRRRSDPAQAAVLERCGDGLIAATARVHGWTLVSRNVKDFEGTGVSVLNPFDLHG
ncbi:type II toxin-antitoxin system VapC family toxin [Microbispora rosea]|uniref:type II toxin-antitoxin system VapC family toxin n=1 Tax=Microbispora rosea TaxID=58117 RepID=UPI0034163359